MSALLVVLAVAALLLSFANGANDTFKGVATLHGDGTLGYRAALAWALATTLAGSFVAVLLAQTLLHAFRGKGLVPDALLAEPAFAPAVAAGAGLTVLAASRFGFPISTTHALVGALVGAGLAAEAPIAWGHLGNGFFLPLAVSPVLAVALTAVAVPLLARVVRRTPVHRALCLCFPDREHAVVPAGTAGAVSMDAAPAGARVSTAERCEAEGLKPAVRLAPRHLGTGLHFLSAGAVGFARGLNDTPKIAALLLAVPALDGRPGTTLAVCGVAMALGGLLGARRVADTMSHRITAMRPAEATTANLATAGLVLGASRLGVPVSTTHVSCGSLFGLGAVNGQARWRTIGRVLLSWVLTLPLAAALAALGWAALG